MKVELIPCILLVPEKEFRGKWHDIVVNVKWSSDDDGFFRIWADGKLRADITGLANVLNNEAEIYFKYGLYRLNLGKFPGMTRKIPTQIVYFDEVRKGKTREDVDIRMIERK